MNRKSLLVLFVVGFLVVGAGMFSLGRYSDKGISSITGRTADEQKDVPENAKGISEISELGDQAGETKSMASKELIDRIILLRKHSNDRNLVKIAALVAQIDAEVRSSEIPSLNLHWDTAVGCVYQTCSDKSYINMIDALSLNEADRKSQSIHSLIETYNLWNGKNQVLFSKSLSKTDTLIESLSSERVIVAWDNLLQCNRECSAFSELTFSLIKEINNG